MVNVLVNGVNVKFRIDIGADITVVSKNIFELLGDVNIMPSSQFLTGLQCGPLIVEKKFIAKVRDRRLLVQSRYILCCKKLKQRDSFSE